MSERLIDLPKMDLQEFVDSGYLQEANRRFFHPLGLALVVSSSDGANFELAGILDARFTPDGPRYQGMDLSIKARKVREEWQSRKRARVEKFGYMVQPAEEISDEVGSDICQLLGEALAQEFPILQAGKETWEKVAKGVLDKVSQRMLDEDFDPEAVTPEEVHVIDLLLFGAARPGKTRAQAINELVDERDYWKEVAETATAALGAIAGRDSHESKLADMALSDLAALQGG